MTMDANPIFKSDLTGAVATPPSTDVKENKDGTYTVVNAIKDNDNNIYKVDDKGKRTKQVIGTTLTPIDFMATNEKTGGVFFDPLKTGITFDLKNSTVSGKVKINSDTYVGIQNAGLEDLQKFGQQLFMEKINQAAPGTFYGKLEILREMSANYKTTNTNGKGSLDFKASLGLNPYTAIRIGTEGSTKITTLRAAGNIIFGSNMALTKPYAISANWYYKQVMKKVGDYNQSQNEGTGSKGYPFYGEHPYSGGFIYYGYFGSFYKN